MRASDQRAESLRVPPTSWQRSFIKQAAFLAAFQFIVLLCVSGLIFIASHIPPKAVNLDGLILFLVRVEWVLESPRKLIFWAWPGELTPRWLGMFSTFVNSFVWGCALALLRQLWRSATK